MLSFQKKDVYGKKDLGGNDSASLLFALHVKSRCSSGTCMCSSLKIKDMEFRLKHGRLLLPALFPIHTAGPDGKRCTGLRAREGFLPMKAFMYAIQRVNNDRRLLSNVSLGYIIFDTCSDPDIATAAFSSFHDGLKFFNQEGEQPMIFHVHAFIDAHDSNVTMALNKKANYHGSSSGFTQVRTVW